MGSKAKAVTDLGLDRLSTHGLLRELGEETISELLREAIEAGLAKVEVGQFPLVTLTEKGELVMHGADNYEMDWPAFTSRTHK
jgi:ATP-dependent DNA helicase RecQ